MWRFLHVLQPFRDLVWLRRDGPAPEAGIFVVCLCEFVGRRQGPQLRETLWCVAERRQFNDKVVDSVAEVE